MKPVRPKLGTITDTTPLKIRTDGDITNELIVSYYVGSSPTVGDRVQWQLDGTTLTIYILTPA